MVVIFTSIISACNSIDYQLKFPEVKCSQMELFLPVDPSEVKYNIVSDISAECENCTNTTTLH